MLTYFLRVHSHKNGKRAKKIQSVTNKIKDYWMYEYTQNTYEQTKPEVEYDQVNLVAV